MYVRTYEFIADGNEVVYDYVTPQWWDGSAGGGGDEWVVFGSGS